MYHLFSPFLVWRIGAGLSIFHSPAVLPVLVNADISKLGLIPIGPIGRKKDVALVTMLEPMIRTCLQRKRWSDILNWTYPPIVDHKLPRFRTLSISYLISGVVTADN